MVDIPDSDGSANRPKQMHTIIVVNFVSCLVKRRALFSRILCATKRRVFIAAGSVNPVPETVQEWRLGDCVRISSDGAPAQASRKYASAFRFMDHPKRSRYGH